MKVMLHQRSRRIDTDDLKKSFPEIDWVEVDGPEGAAADIADTDVLCINTLAYNAELAKVVLGNAKQLKWIHFTTSGIDWAIDAGGFPAGVTVTNSAGLRAPNLTDHAFAMLLFMARKFRRLEEARREKYWAREDLWENIIGLDGLTMTIFGMGAIGQVAARKAKAFNMKVLGISRTYKPDDLVDTVYPRKRAKEAFAAADAVLIAVPSEPDTRGFVNAEIFNAMKKTAFLINVSRGDIVNEPDLIAALKAGTIAGAGIDVMVKEPMPPENELWSLENAFIAPHVGGAGTRSDAPMLRIFAENLRLFLGSQPLRNLVDWPAMMN